MCLLDNLKCKVTFPKTKYLIIIYICLFSGLFAEHAWCLPFTNANDWCVGQSANIQEAYQSGAYGWHGRTSDTNTDLHQLLWQQGVAGFIHHVELRVCRERVLWWLGQTWPGSLTEYDQHAEFTRLLRGGDSVWSWTLGNNGKLISTMFFAGS